MINFSKTTWITIILVIAFCVAGFSAYQWWQATEELKTQINQKKELTEQLIGLKALVEKKKYFEVCREIEIPYREIGFEIKTSFSPSGSLGSLEAVSMMIDPDGEVVGRGGISQSLLEGKGDLYYTEWPQYDEFFMYFEISEKKSGDYLLIIKPRLGTNSPASKNAYTIQIEISGVQYGNENSLVLSQNIPLSEYFEDQLYIFRVTKDKKRIIPIVPASVGCGF